ncbi:hypothetical protein [Nostoc sp.]|uniref:hypothetical protein n=1 Tax=Nostoc sp. TaxID=1180 RepID=UPI002FFCEDA1
MGFSAKCSLLLTALLKTRDAVRVRASYGTLMHGIWGDALAQRASGVSLRGATLLLTPDSDRLGLVEKR